jgi:hypothetical protein
MINMKFTSLVIPAFAGMTELEIDQSLLRLI